MTAEREAATAGMTGGVLDLVSLSQMKLISIFLNDRLVFALIRGRHSCMSGCISGSCLYLPVEEAFLDDWLVFALVWK
jgi:hypothetical protein